MEKATQQPTGKKKESGSGFKLKIPGLNFSKTAADDSLVYFITFVYGLATAEITPSELLRTAGAAGYGIYSKIFTDIYTLGIRWQYGVATGAEIVASQLKGMEEFRLFLMKMEQVIRLGDSMKDFLKSEMWSVFQAYASSYERSMESLKLLLGMFSTLMSTASFMIAALMIMTMIGGVAGDSNMIMVVTFAVIAGLGSFAFMMYMIFPRDALVDGRGGQLEKLKKLTYLTLGAGAGIGTVLGLTGIVPPGLAICAAGAPLILPGLKARKIEAQTRSLSETYPSFIRHLAEVYATVGSLGQALKAVMKSDFGGLTLHARKMVNRVLNRVTIEDAFNLFSIDSGSTTVTAGNNIVAGSMAKGANMVEVGDKIADIISKLNELKKKRLQVAKAFETTVLILHVLTLTVMSFMKEVFELFTKIFSNVDTSLTANTVITPVPSEAMIFIMPVMIIALSGINGLVIKVAQGGLYRTIWFNIGILMVIGGLVSFAIDIFASQMFDEMLQLNPLTSAV